MRRHVAEKIATEVAEWGHAGLVDSALRETLEQRYGSHMTMGRVMLRWLGFSALFLLAMSLLGSIGMLVGAGILYVAPIILAGLSAVAWQFGVRFATDPLQRYATSGSVLVTASFFGFLAALATAYASIGADEWQYALASMLVVVGSAAIWTAYRYGLRWPLVVGVLLIFHAIGNRHGYWGRGSYFIGVRDEWLMLSVAILAIGVGLWHERHREAKSTHRHLGFGHVFVIVGLLYANMSVWMLSIPGRELGFVLFFTAFTIGQIVLGARLHDSRITGFGIVFLSINLYTRMFESFWDEVSKGLFFLVAGAVALAAGIVFESLAKKRR